MCGIFGVIGPESHPDWRRYIASRFPDFSDVRGKDSTGFAWFDKENNLKIMKAAIAGDEFVKTEDFKEWAKNTPEIFIGHVRKKTVGSETDPHNNHPIFSPDSGLALTHNGGIANHEVFRAKDEDGTNPYMWKDEYDGEVDSEVLLRMIETLWRIPREKDGKILPEKVAATKKEDWKISVSLLRAIEDSVYNLVGSQAAALLNQNESNTLYLWRTEDRPLEIAYVPEHKAIVYASTPDILEKSLNEDHYEYLFGVIPKKIFKTPEIINATVGTNSLFRIEWVGGKEQFNITYKKLPTERAKHTTSFRQKNNKVIVYGGGSK